MKKILHFFAQPTPLGILLPILFGVICWGISYQFSPEVDSTTFLQAQDSWLAKTLQGLIAPHSFLSYSLGLIFTLFIGLSLFMMNESFSFIRVRTILPYFFFVLLIGFHQGSHEFSLGQVACLFLVASLAQLFSAYQVQNSVFQSFNIGLFLSLGSLCTAELLFFLPLFWIGLISFSSFSFRSFLASIIGIITPYLIILGIAFLFSKTTPLIHSFLGQFHFDINFSIGIIFALFIGILLISAIIATVESLSDKIKTRRLLVMAFLFFFILMLSFSFIPNELDTFYIFCVAFLSLIYTHYFSSNSSLVDWLFSAILILGTVHFISYLF